MSVSEGSGTDDQPSGLPPGVGTAVLGATILASSMAFIDGSALNVALPVLQTDLGASGVQLLWIVNGYLLTLAALIVVGGALGDRLGRKRVFMAGIALFLLASLACGLAPTPDVLIGARVVQGVGGALMIPGSLSLIAAIFGDRRGQAIGTWSAATTIVTIAGPLLGGVLASAGLWRGVFLINLPLGVAALFILQTRVPESRAAATTGRIDYVGAALLTVGLAGLSYGFLSAPDFGFADPRVVGALGGGVLALIALLIVEARSPYPMVPLTLFRSRTFSGTNLLTLFLYGALTVGTFFLSLNLVQVQGYSPALAGAAFLPFALLLSFLSRRMGAMADRYGPRLLLVAGPALAGCGFLALGMVGLTDGPLDYWTSFFPGLVLLGLGMAVTVAPLTTAVMGAAPAQMVGTASGINNAVSRTAGVLALAIVGAAALTAFAGALTAHTAGLPLAPTAHAALQAQVPQLAAATAPPGLPPAQATAVQQAIKLAFVDVFRLVQFLCAGLAGMSALMAGLLVEGRPAGQPADHAVAASELTPSD